MLFGRKRHEAHETRGCGECHGPDGAGRVMIDDEGGLFVKTPDITRGPGGVVADYTEADWVRTLREKCRAAGTAFYFKQVNGAYPGMDARLDGRIYHEMPAIPQPPLPLFG